MATAQISPAAVAPNRDRNGNTKADVPADATEFAPHRGPLRTALRAAGVFLDTAWRVVLLGGEGL